MRGYGQFCPVAKAAEILAERWTPLVIRELLYGHRRFNDLHRGVPLMSRTLLAQRLQELERAGVVARRQAPLGRGSEYQLTPAGEALRPVIEQLGEWGTRHARPELAPDDLDAGLLVWHLRRMVDVARAPAGRLVIRLELRALPRRDQRRATWWLVATPEGVDVCLKDPGFDVDLVVHADLAALTRLALGKLGYGEAVRLGLVAVEGPRALVRAFPALMRFPETPAGAAYRIAPAQWVRRCAEVPAAAGDAGGAGGPPESAGSLRRAAATAAPASSGSRRSGGAASGR
jgi:DNA-binding HxlR family transcriptional regulator